MATAGENPVNNAFTDLMTSFAVIFILLLVVYLNASYQQTQKGSANAKKQLMDRLATMNIQAEDDPKDPLAFVIRVQNDTLQFDVNKALLKPPGKLFMKSFTGQLTSVVCNKKSQTRIDPEVETMLIQGFTDSDGNDELNLQLSQDRALAVLKEALVQLPAQDYRRSCLLDLASTNGLGERARLDTKGKLLAENARPGVENKAKSRRVEFKIRVKSFEQRRTTATLSSVAL